MHKKFDLLWLLALIVVSTLLLFNLTTKGIYSSHDGEIHISRIAQFKEALKYDYLPIRWFSNFNFGFGYPTFVYSYSLPYYFSSLIDLLVRDYEITFKLLILLSVIFSSFTFYYFAKLTFSRLAAFAGSVFYISAPYRFADIYERGALGEFLAFIISPLLFMSPYILSRNICFGFIFTALVVFSFISVHAITFVIFLFATIAISPLIFRKHFKLYFYFICAVGFGFLLSAFQWMPMIFEQKYIELDKTYFNIYEGNFISIYQLLRIPKEGINIGTGIQLGSAQIIIIIATAAYILVNLVNRKKQNSHLIFFLITALIAAFLTTDLSKSIWHFFKPLQAILFSWRFLTYTTFSTALLACFLIDKLQKSKVKIIFFLALIFIAIYPSRHYLMGYNWHTYEKDFYSNYNDYLKLDNYYLPKGLTQNLENLQLAPISIISGDGQAKLINRYNHRLEAILSLEQSSTVQLHMIYFPGWELFIDNQRSQIVTNYPKLEGIIVARVPEGSHKLTLKFEETLLRKIANFLTLGSFLTLVLIVILRKRNVF